MLERIKIEDDRMRIGLGVTSEDVFTFLARAAILVLEAKRSVLEVIIVLVLHLVVVVVVGRFVGGVVCHLVLHILIFIDLLLGLKPELSRRIDEFFNINVAGCNLLWCGLWFFWLCVIFVNLFLEGLDGVFQSNILLSLRFLRDRLTQWFLQIFGMDAQRLDQGLVHWAESKIIQQLLVVLLFSTAKR